MHGYRDVDEYAWMRHDPAGLAEYLADERAYYDGQTQTLAALTSELYGEAVGRTPTAADDSVGWTLRGYRYWHRTPAGAENRQLLRAPLAGPAAEQLLIDENVLAADSGYVDVGTSEPSPDDRLLAWSADTSGSEIYQLRFTEIGTGRVLPDLIERSYPGGAWAGDSAHFFYLVPDELNRPYQVWRHTLGTAAETDVKVYEETDQRFELTLEASRSGGLIIITAESRDTTEVWLIPASRPLSMPVVVEPRQRGIEYRVDHAADPAGGDGELWIVTNSGAANSGAANSSAANSSAANSSAAEFTLMRAPVAAPGQANWTPAGCPATAPARSDTRLLRCDALAGHLLLTLRRDGAPLLAITGPGSDHQWRQVTEIRPAMTAGTIAVQHAADYQAGSVVIVEQSLIEPPRWSALDLATGERKELKRAEVPGYDAGRYRTERVSAQAADGTHVPVTLAYRFDTPLDGTAACLLYGYGAYEACWDPEFDASLVSALDRGMVYAIAHVRGGGEGGRQWWQQGRLR
ncbi:MAG TPA: hypothetical protein VGH53_09705, partial [Streptosporangiaceae bacterium]